ncbi:MAG: acetyl-CoA synthase subunit gamma, partial [Actinobacteria bacterium]
MRSRSGCAGCAASRAARRSARRVDAAGRAVRTMAECGPASCCCGGAAPDSYDYGPQPYVDGSADTFAGVVPRVSTALTSADRLGELRVRMNLGRDDFRVQPGLYALGAPDDTAPVLVTANYRLSFDAVRACLAGRDAWLLVLDTRGVNVWCAAGKGTFGTAELVRRVRDTQLAQVVSHRRLVVPQLGATGVAAHRVRAESGFAVAWGPVRAADLPAFLDAGMEATAEMRRVRFPLRDRARLVGVELSVLWDRRVLIGLAVAAVA